MATLLLAILVLVTMERGLLMPSQRLRPMLDFCTEDMDMVVLAMLDLAMLLMVMAMLPLLPMATLLLAMVVLAMLVMDMLDMVTVLDMAVGSTTVKQLIYASKSSKAIFLLFSALCWGRNFFSCSD